MNPTPCRNWPIGCSPRTCSPISASKRRSAPAATAPCSTSCALIAYREVRAFKRDGSLDTFRARLERVAIGINMQFPEALRLSEVRAIARSVARVDLAAFQQREILDDVAEAPHQHPLGRSCRG